jgi:hypothetical protein
MLVFGHREQLKNKEDNKNELGVERIGYCGEVSRERHQRFSFLMQDSQKCFHSLTSTKNESAQMLQHS